MQLYEYYNITVDRFKEYQAKHKEKDYILIDVRLPEEYEDEHIAGAVLLPLGELTDRLNELPLDRDIIFYCNSGRRSRAASLFVTSVPFTEKNIYNIQGGILTYFDHTLPDYPTLEAFDLGASMENLLLSAMNLERGTSFFYEAVIEKSGNAPFCEILKKIARAEEAHARLLYNYWKEEQQSPPSFEEVYNSLKGEVVEGGKRLDEQLARLEEYQQSSPQALLEIILDIEYAAYDLYTAIAEQVQAAKVKESFFSLAQAEKHHMQLAAGAFKDLKEIQQLNTP